MLHYFHYEILSFRYKVTYFDRWKLQSSVRMLQLWGLQRPTYKIYFSFTKLNYAIKMLLWAKLIYVFFVFFFFFTDRILTFKGQTRWKYLLWFWLCATACICMYKICNVCQEKNMSVASESLPVHFFFRLLISNICFFVLFDTFCLWGLKNLWLY